MLRDTKIDAEDVKLVEAVSNPGFESMTALVLKNEGNQAGSKL